MIVNATPNGWEVIYHRAHALLATELAGQWRHKDAPARLYETLAAPTSFGASATRSLFPQASPKS